MSSQNKKLDAINLEKYRGHFLKKLAHDPVKISSGEPEESPDFWRVVIDTPEDFDKLLHQLRADTVTKEEALNPTLVQI